MKIRYEMGDVVERECARDSAYMLVAMRKVGVGMRLKFHWVHMNVILDIVLDNDGGYGTNLCVV